MPTSTTSLPLERTGPTRIVVTGCPGSGKSVLASTLAVGLGLPYVELDALFHGPDWTPADPDVFSSTVGRLVDGPGWVVDGNYSAVREIVRSRADLIVALDLPRPVVFVRLLRRTLTRMATRAELWNGNKEQWRNLVSLDPDRNLLLWAHRHFGTYRQRAIDDERASRSGGPRAVRLTSPGQVDRFSRYLVGR